MEPTALETLNPSINRDAREISRVKRLNCVNCLNDFLSFMNKHLVRKNDNNKHSLIIPFVEDKLSNYKSKEDKYLFGSMRRQKASTL
jgi:hypothetical protein